MQVTPNVKRNLKMVQGTHAKVASVAQSAFNAQNRSRACLHRCVHVDMEMTEM